MIKIEKPSKPPKILIGKGAKENEENCATYDSGQRKFEFQKKIYGAQSVKNTLLHAQHGKCCYCESRVRATSYGDVEHYRPKGAVKQVKNHPGYYWLAYDWNNLLFSCEACNRSHKGTLFPLKNPGARARSHHDDIDDEQPLFVNPGVEDPRKHIRFQGERPVPRTKVGRKTIEGIGLRREDLEDRRRERLQVLRALQDIIEIGKDSTDSKVKEKVREAQEHLAASIRPNAEYSSMVQDFLGT